MTLSGDLVIKQLFDANAGRIKQAQNNAAPFQDVYDFVARMRDDFPNCAQFGNNAGQLYEDLIALDIRTPDQVRNQFLQLGNQEHSNQLLDALVAFVHATGDDIVQRTFQVLELAGGIILKPFTPTPDGQEHRKHRRYLDAIPHKLWSPHFFPFAELNGINGAVDPDAQDFAIWFTEHYAAIAQENYTVYDYPNETVGGEQPSQMRIFARLEQVAKAIAFARFLRDNNIPIDFSWMETYDVPTRNTPTKRFTAIVASTIVTRN